MKIDTLRIPLPEDIQILKHNGQFELVKEMIDLRVQKDIPSKLKERLLLEKELIELYPREYIYTKEQAVELLSSHIKDFTEEEFDQLFKESAFQFIMNHGVMMFKDDIYTNLISTRKAYDLRCDTPNDGKRFEMLNRIITKMEEKGEVSVKIHVKLTLKLKEEAQKVGKMIRVWLPIPVEYAQVEDLKIISFEPEGIINDAKANHRSVYFEVPYQKDQVFSVEYEFVNHSIYRELDPSIVTDEHPDCCLGEKQPHFVFTDYLKDLTKEVVGEETNPLLKAKKIYEYITSHVMYSTVPPYINLPSIPEFVATGLKGDCGIQASLFINMCRIEGIPADFQAGLYANPEMIANHDWARFYVAPYGWLFADCSFGGSAFRNQSKLRRDFYFGHLEPYRIPSARGILEPLVPEKTFTRRDPYDHQTGEVEYVDEMIDEKYIIMEQEMIEIKELD